MSVEEISEKIYEEELKLLSEDVTYRIMDEYVIFETDGFTIKIPTDYEYEQLIEFLDNIFVKIGMQPLLPKFADDGETLFYRYDNNTVVAVCITFASYGEILIYLQRFYELKSVSVDELFREQKITIT